MTSLWQDHWSAPSNETRNALLLQYLPLVAQAVQRIPYQMRMHHESHDLESYGVLGLIKAIERFDPSSAVYRFPSYALICVRGAIVDELRRLDWLPRSARRHVMTFAKTSEALAGPAGRMPSRREVLAEMSASEREAREVEAALPTSQLLSLNAVSPSSDSDGVPIATDPEEDPETRCLRVARQAALRSALSQLNDRQRALLDMHWAQRRTQAEIGTVLGISGSRVCQLEAQAINALREKLQCDGWAPSPTAARP